MDVGASWGRKKKRIIVYENDIPRGQTWPRGVFVTQCSASFQCYYIRVADRKWFHLLCGLLCRPQLCFPDVHTQCFLVVAFLRGNTDTSPLVCALKFNFVPCRLATALETKQERSPCLAWCTCKCGTHLGKTASENTCWLLHFRYQWCNIF